MLARTHERLDAIQRQIPKARRYRCDVTDETQLDSVIEAVRRDLGSPKVLVHNALGGASGNFLEIDPKALAHDFQVNMMALWYLAGQLAPAMVEAGEGAIVATGNTSALRGKPRLAGFAPTEAAQRILAESIAREREPKGGLCRLRCDRRGYRLGMDPADAFQARGRPILHPAVRDRRRDLARGSRGPIRVVVQRRTQAFPGNVVKAI
jgi:NAD(P)-dependent dehydrogenase (short-subunit alcohol dehydrogenase family)